MIKLDNKTMETKKLWIEINRESWDNLENLGL